MSCSELVLILTAAGLMALGWMGWACTLRRAVR